MGRIAQRVDPARLALVLAPHARAAIAFERDGALEALPAVYRRRGEQHWIGVAREAMRRPRITSGIDIVPGAPSGADPG